jgi:CubicO group peptidase (beta-lactamase class C family)
MNQFANILTQNAKQPLATIFKNRIADPIGMNPGQWRWGVFGKVDGYTVNGGAGNKSKHIFISTREMLRFGHLFLNRGKWGDQQIISADWVDAVHAVHVPASLPLGHPESGIDGRGVYGYNWWTNGMKQDGTRKWPGAPKSTFAASGYNNNDMFVIPEWNMVVVRLGLDQNDLLITDEIYGTFLQKIGNAILDLQ